MAARGRAPSRAAHFDTAQAARIVGRAAAAAPAVRARRPASRRARDARGRLRFDFVDLVLLRTTRGLLDRGVPLRQIGRVLDVAAPPDRRRGRSRGSRVYADGERVVAWDGATPLAAGVGPVPLQLRRRRRSCGRAGKRRAPARAGRRRRAAAAHAPTSGAISRSRSRSARRSRRAPPTTTRSTSTRRTSTARINLGRLLHARRQPRRRRGPLPRGRPPRARRARSPGTTWACARGHRARRRGARLLRARGARRRRRSPTRTTTWPALRARGPRARTPSATSPSIAGSSPRGADGAARRRDARVPRVLVGTSGFSYPAWRGTFYPDDLPARDDARLLRAACSAPSRSTTPSTACRRRRCSPAGRARRRAGFRFALKAPQRITHQLRLRTRASSTRALLRRSPRRSATKLGPLLFQLPPYLRADAARLDELPRRAARRASSRRSSSAATTWFNDETYGAPRARTAPRSASPTPRTLDDAARRDRAVRLPAPPARGLRRRRPRRAGPTRMRDDARAGSASTSTSSTTTAGRGRRWRARFLDAARLTGRSVVGRASHRAPRLRLMERERVVRDSDARGRSTQSKRAWQRGAQRSSGAGPMRRAARRRPSPPSPTAPAGQAAMHARSTQVGHGIEAVGRARRGHARPATRMRRAQRDPGPVDRDAPGRRAGSRRPSPAHAARCMNDTGIARRSGTG